MDENDGEDEILTRAPSDLMLNERAVVRSTGKMAIREFLHRHTLYEVIRDSGKVGEDGWVRMGGRGGRAGQDELDRGQGRR